MVIDDKGERNEQIYELSLDDKGGNEMRVRSWTWIKRSNIEEDRYSWTRGAILRKIDIFGQEEHTSRGSKLMNLVA